MEVYGLGLCSTMCNFLKVAYRDSRIIMVFLLNLMGPESRDEPQASPKACNGKKRPKPYTLNNSPLGLELRGSKAEVLG